jgi:hydrogenase maturation protein HypF
MNDRADLPTVAETARLIRVRGLVQGVGFRPTVWRLARRFELRGWVANDGEGVSIYACGHADSVGRFLLALRNEAPPLARIDAIEHEPALAVPLSEDFRIVASQASGVHTGVVPDAVSCAACVAESFDPFGRRYRYPFTNCTHCGPRLSIVESIPYDRAATTMRAFTLCVACRAEYEDPEDRRFHAQPIACHTCGPHAWLERADGAAIAIDTLTTLDHVDAACSVIQRGHILAIKGLGGFQLACDAGNESAVSRLRALKRREGKPFALMARDLDVMRRYCAIGSEAEALLRSPAGPIVIMDAHGPERVAPSVAPGVNTLGFMLPGTPLHHLWLRRMNRPVVLTSGNLSDEPQCIHNADARARLSGIAEYFLMHDRDIASRVDDSVARIAGGNAQILRRARGYAPAPIRLPDGFAGAPATLAMGAELKNAFCLLREGQAILSHHMGDLEEARTQADYRSSIERYLSLFEHAPKTVAIDLHPEYVSSTLGRDLAAAEDLPLVEVQHHHAHLAACMIENGIALDTRPVLGVALDGLGYGADRTLWGGEFLLVDYRACQRLATFKPVALLGGEKAMHEPWRNTYAHLKAEMGWARFAMNFAELELFDFLHRKPRETLDAMLAQGVNSPLASSCGRLFDAVAAAAGICREHVQFEGQAAIELEAVIQPHTLRDEDDELAYPFAIPRMKDSNLPYIEPLAMWQALLGDLILKTPVPVIAARFHKGVAIAIVRMIEKLSRYECGEEPIQTVALSGGVFQNRVLLEQIVERLERLQFRVLTHSRVPANDGGLALGQAAVAAARALHPQI